MKLSKAQKFALIRIKKNGNFAKRGLGEATYGVNGIDMNTFFSLLEAGFIECVYGADSWPIKAIITQAGKDALEENK